MRVQAYRKSGCTYLVCLLALLYGNRLCLVCFSPFSLRILSCHSDLVQLLLCNSPRLDGLCLLLLREVLRFNGFLPEF